MHYSVTHTLIPMAYFHNAHPALSKIFLSDFGRLLGTSARAVGVCSGSSTQRWYGMLAAVRDVARARSAGSSGT